MKRLVFGVDESGKNVLLHQDPLRPLGNLNDASDVSERMYLAWAATESVHDGFDVASTLPHVALDLKPGEVRFLRVEIAAGAESTYHRTPNITDYLIALSGALTMFTEDGRAHRIEAGDMFVQLGGWHYWRNEGTEPFVMAGTVVGVQSDIDVPYGVEFRDDK